MNLPCPNKIDCDCADGNPLSNFSSETAEELEYRAVSWLTPGILIGQDPSVDPNNRPPTLCADPRSPLYALLCARRNSYINGVPFIGTDTEDRPEVFFNAVAQCELPCPDGNVTRVQVGAGEFVGSDPYTPDRQAADLACQLAYKARICLSDITRDICEGTFHADSIVATTRISTFEITSGMLPPGLTLGRLNNFTLGITGTPTATGTFVFTLHVTNPAGGDMTKTYTISVLGIVNDSPLAEATEGAPYAAILTGDGGTPGYTFTVSTGVMPAGLILDPTGLISGTPSESGDFDFNIEIADSATPPQSCFKDFTMHVVSTAVTCPSNLQTYALANVNGIIGSVDPVVGRVFIARTGANDIYDSITDAFVAAAGVSVNSNSGGAWVKTTQQFATRGTVLAGSGYWLTDSTTGATTQIGNNLSLFSIPCYADDDDACWGIGWDNPGTQDILLTRLNIGTLLVDISVNVGNSASSPFYTAYCSAPKTLLVTGVGTSDTLTLYSLPGGGVVASFDFASGGFGSLFELVYNPITATFFAAIVQDAPGFAEQVVEISPINMAVIRTYPLGTVNGGSTMNLGVNPDNGAIYCHSTGVLSCIDAVAQVILCQIPNTGFQATFDKASGRIFGTILGPSRVQHFDK